MGKHMTDQDQPSPLPLSYDEASGEVRDVNGRLIADMPGIYKQDCIDGAFIVHAVNSHVKLVEALEKIATITIHIPQGESPLYGTQRLREIARAALALAKEGK